MNNKYNVWKYWMSGDNSVSRSVRALFDKYSSQVMDQHRKCMMCTVNSTQYIPKSAM